MKDDGQKIDGLGLLSAIPEDWLAPTLEIARTMAAAGQRVWIVGGGVRDLILGRPIKDIDLVSAALPEQVEGLFERTVPVGKAFGIVVVVLGGKEIEVATFRKERGYSDSRRPDEVEYADSADVDAGRRDFTCNALYLDPLNGEIVDPSGGLADLMARELRAVGDPAARFREDGLRLLRAGRFLASLTLQPAPGLLEAMAAEVDSIGGVSPERVLDETAKILRGPDPARAIRVLSETGVLSRCLPGWTDRSVDGAASADFLARCLPSASRGAVSPVALGLAVLLDPQRDGDAETTTQRLEELKTSRDLRTSVLSLLRVRGELLALMGEATPTAAVAVGEWVALARDPAFEAGVTLTQGADAEVAPDLAATVEVLRALSASAPLEPVELAAKDAMALGIRPGPELGDLLRRAKLASLGGAFSDLEGGLAWLAAEIR